MEMLVRTADQSILSPDGRVLFFSVDRFAHDICEGDACFVCGTAQGTKPFNNEHIIPNWLLHRFDLHEKEITLPNGRTHQYGTYTVDCCVDCNKLLDRELEYPLSAVLREGHAAVANLLQHEGSARLFIWMATIFLKIHLKDTTLRQHANFNDGDAKIAEDYDWALFHHLHCLARAVYTKPVITPQAYGSLAVMPALPGEQGRNFDLVDLSIGQTLMIRMNDVVLYAVFNDACAAIHGIRDWIELVSRPLNPVQARELAAHFACCNMHLENPPRFQTRVVNGNPPKVFIDGSHDPIPKFADRDKALFGSLRERVLGDALPRIQVPGRTPEEVMSLMSAGELSFMRGDDGQFITSPTMRLS